MATRIVTGTWLAPDGVTAQRGVVLLAPSRRLIRMTPPRAIVPERPITVTLDGAGSITVDLPCTDDPDLEPPGWCWTIVEQLHGAPQRSWSFALPDEPGALDLATIDPLLVG